MKLSEPSTSARRYFEFHDSTLKSYKLEGDLSVLLFDPGYVHYWECVNGTWSGTGWNQQVGIGIYWPPNSRESVWTDLPTRVTTGSIRIGENIFSNLVPVPLSVTGAVELQLEFEGGDLLCVFGQFVRIQAYGEATYVEDLPNEWAPEARAT